MTRRSEAVRSKRLTAAGWLGTLSVRHAGDSDDWRGVDSPAGRANAVFGSGRCQPGLHRLRCDWELDGPMKRTVGLSLLGVSVVGVLVTAYGMWVKATLVADPLHHARRMRSYWLLAGLILACACNVFLIGLFLLRSDPADRTGGVTTGRSRRVFALPVYLVTSVTIGLLASHAEITRSHVTGLAWYFLCPPSIIMQFFSGPVKSIGSHPMTGCAVTILLYMLYYAGFFYPLYRRRYTTMRVLAGIHLVVGFVLLGVVGVLHAH